MLLFLLHWLSLLAIGVQSYNLDLQNFQLFEDPQAKHNERPSYFGFSVALYALGLDSLLLVGAPRANSTTTRGFIEPGAVYSCPLFSSGSCVEWPIDTLPQASILGQISSEKSRNHAWLGATISVQNTTKAKVAVCAPRWTKIEMSYNRENWFMNGMCYSTLANNDSSSFTRPAMRRHKPISNDLRMQTIELTKGQYKGQFVHHQGMAELGFSMHQTADIHGDFILGAPGFYRWTGNTIFIDERDQRDSTRAVIPNVVDDSHLQFDDYLGYSVTSGRFYKLSERLYASSAPRGANYIGRVFIHSFPSRNASQFSFRKILEGEQHGEYFGASLTSCDVNGDGRDDLIIGAPLWSRDSDEGRVHVYQSKGQSEFEVQKLEGEFEGGRFGTVVGCLNDLDFDGYADVAVGAPYEDNGRGAVYIFNGSPEGLSVVPSQRIGAVDLSMDLRGFGLSISEPRDIDGNRFPDLAIGAYNSGHAVVLRSRPVVNLNIKLIKSQNFTLMQNSTYFVVDVCVSYDGPFAPAYFDAIKTLTIDEVHKRAIVYQNGRLFGNIYRVTDTLRKGEEKCASIKINLKKNVQNAVEPIEIMGKITLNENSNCSYCPVINTRSSKVSDNLKLAYFLDCGEDNVCNSDLRVEITSVSNDENRFVIGSSSTYNVTILVENSEEPAYKTQARVYIPLPITFSRIPLECDEKQEINKILEVICNLGNPLRFNNTMTMELDMRAIKSFEESNEIRVLGTTQSEEENLSNNLATLNINYDIDARITISGKTDGNLYSFEEQDVVDKKFKPVTVKQIYEIWKIGPTPIQESVVIIHVPTYWEEEKITKVRQVQVSVDGQLHECDGLFSIDSNLTFSEIDIKSERNNSLIIPSEERTIFINCTSQNITCQKFACNLGPLLKTQSLATLTMTIDFQLPNSTEIEYKGKDIIYFVSEGFVKVSSWNLTDELINELFSYDVLATNFFIGRKPEPVAMWVIILSVLLGIVLILLLALLLIKVGFFNRKRKEDLNHTRSSRQLNVVDDD